jgi:hypothetical protein
MFWITITLALTSSRLALAESTVAKNGAIE